MSRTINNQRNHSTPILEANTVLHLQGRLKQLRNSSLISYMHVNGLFFGDPDLHMHSLSRKYRSTEACNMYHGSLFASNRSPRRRKCRNLQCSTAHLNLPLALPSAFSPWRSISPAVSLIASFAASCASSLFPSQLPLWRILLWCEARKMGTAVPRAKSAKRTKKEQGRTAGGNFESQHAFVMTLHKHLNPNIAPCA